MTRASIARRVARLERTRARPQQQAALQIVAYDEDYTTGQRVYHQPPPVPAELQGGYGFNYQRAIWPILAREEPE
jgi:hypothetical protein